MCALNQGMFLWSSLPTLGGRGELGKALTNSVQVLSMNSGKNQMFNLKKKEKIVSFCSVTAFSFWFRRQDFTKTSKQMFGN